VAEPPASPAGTFAPAQEFDCCECGRHIIVIAGPISQFELCAACIFMPGWFTTPEMVRFFDPSRELRADG
jgi:hypothetical protein